MRTLTFYQILARCVRATGWTMDSPDVANRLPVFAELIEDWTRRGLEEEFWPDSMRIVQKTVQTADGEHYVEKGEPWETDSIGLVDVRECLFAQRPVLPDLSGALEHCGEYDNRITCADSELPDEVYVYCQIEPPRFTSTEHDLTATYAAGDMAFYADTRQCYMSRQNENTGHAVTETDWWLVQPFPAFLQSYVKWGVASEFLSEEQGKYKTAGRADKELTRLRGKVDWTARRGA